MVYKMSSLCKFTIKSRISNRRRNFFAHSPTHKQQKTLIFALFSSPALNNVADYHIIDVAFGHTLPVSAVAEVFIITVGT